MFVKLDPDFFPNCLQSESLAEEMGIKLEQYYWEALEFLGNEDHSNDVSYNLLVFKNFLLIALRRVEAVKEENRTVTVNSLGFAGTHAVKREEDLLLLNKYSPIGILELVSTPVEDNEDN